MLSSIVQSVALFTLIDYRYLYTLPVTLTFSQRECNPISDLHCVTFSILNKLPSQIIKTSIYFCLSQKTGTLKIICFQKTKYRIFRPITRALSIQKGSEIVKNEHAQYTLERFPTNNARIICAKKGIRKYGIMY